MSCHDLSGFLPLCPHFPKNLTFYFPSSMIEIGTALTIGGYMNEKMTKRKQQAMETRKKILTCALDLFAQKGYDDVTMQEIARQAGVSVGSIYRYYKSKDEIAAQSTEPLDDLYSAFFDELMTSEQYAERTAIEKLELFYLYVQKTVSLYDNLRSLYIYTLKNPESNMLVMADNRELYRTYHILLDACRKEGSMKEELSSEEALDLLLQSSRGIIVDWLIRNKEFDFESHARRWFALILREIQK